MLLEAILQCVELLGIISCLFVIALNDGELN